MIVLPRHKILNNAPRASTSNTYQAFPHHNRLLPSYIKMYFYSLINLVASLAVTTLAAPTLNEGVSFVNLNNRQTSNPCSIWTPSTQLVGDGAPRNRWLMKQVTDEIHCGDASTCAIQAGEYESLTIGADLTGGNEWISGGLSVEKSWETGTSWTCEDEEGSKICLWIKIAHTEYEVDDGSYNSCTGFSSGRKHRITSPNRNNEGGYHECSTSDCRVKGAEYWIEG
ncbi:hypothetical protein BKA70DRAFT_1319183 [Coprinopsis sp. MPI-PUGE-AT-0042]|nr:hypothetical protein BKA70DRAFT_1319183 [Coprinopsis sp. MPI-PUGE-AT-0042]